MRDQPTAIITTHPHPKNRWLILLIPVFTIVLVAFPIGVINSLTVWKPSPPLTFAIWALLSAAIMLWCFVYDPELLTFTLTAIDLRRGKRNTRVIFKFDDIESIVVGIPSRLPWFLRWAKIHPNYHRALAVRSASIFVRLRNRRRIPINFATGQFINGDSLMQQFVQLNASKIVGSETYSEAELRKMERADLNRIFQL